MSSAFKNFLITLLIGLVVFSALAWYVVYPFFQGILNGDDTPSDESSGEISEISTDESQDDNSSDTSAPPVKTGKSFTAVIVGKAADGLVSSVVYLRINQATENFIYCFIPTSTTITNSLGIDEPIRTAFASDSGEGIKSYTSALTGTTVDYYGIISTDDLKSFSTVLTNASINVSADIKYLKPEYVSLAANMEDDEIPDEYYVRVGKGTNVLTSDFLANILGYNPNPDTGVYHTYAAEVHKAFFLSYFTSGLNQENAFKIVNFISQTDITTSDFENYWEILMTYNVYTTKNVNYPSTWTQAASAFAREDT